MNLYNLRVSLSEMSEKKEFSQLNLGIEELDLNWNEIRNLQSCSL